MKWIHLALLGAVSSCASAPAPAPSNAVASSVTSPHAQFAGFHTFSFGLADPPRPGYAVTPRSLEVQRQLRPIVLDALQQRGYTETDGKSDFIVKLVTGTGEVPNEHAERDVPTGLALGFIGINIYDAATGGQVWQGSAFAEIDPAKIDQGLLKMGVAHMMGDFPAMEKASVATTK